MAAAGPATDLWPRTTRVLPWTIAAFTAMLFLVPFDAMTITGGQARPSPAAGHPRPLAARAWR